MLWHSQQHHKIAFLSRRNQHPEEKLLTQTIHTRLQCYLEEKNGLAEVPYSIFLFSSIYETGEKWMHLTIIWTIDASNEKCLILITRSEINLI